MSEARPLALSCSLLSELPVSPVLPVSPFISSSLELESRSPTLGIVVVVILFDEGLIFGQTGRGLEGRCCGGGGDMLSRLLELSALLVFVGGAWGSAALLVWVTLAGWGGRGTAFEELVESKGRGRDIGCLPAGFCWGGDRRCCWFKGWVLVLDGRA